MVKFISLKPRESMAQIRKALAQSCDEEQKTRIRAIINVKEGKRHTQVAKDLIISRTSLISWIVAYNQGGIEALKMSKGGRKEGNPKWDTSIFDKLVKEIDKGGYWSIPKMQEWIQKNLKEIIPEQTIWYHLNKLNYSNKSARPHPTQGNKDKQDVFKKGALFRSWSR